VVWHTGSCVVHSNYNSYWIWLKDICNISGLKYSEKYLALKYFNTKYFLLYFNPDIYYISILYIFICTYIYQDWNIARNIWHWSTSTPNTSCYILILICYIYLLTISNNNYNYCEPHGIPNGMPPCLYLLLSVVLYHDLMMALWGWNSCSRTILILIKQGCVGRYFIYSYLK
jgi:hypothetical protein